MSTAEQVFLKWAVLQGDVSNSDVASFSNVSVGWRNALHQVLLEQAVSDQTNQLLLLPSMLRCIIEGDNCNGRMRKNGRKESRVPRDNETFCAAWFRSEGIKETRLAMTLSKEEELEIIQQQIYKAMLLANNTRPIQKIIQFQGRFAPNGAENLDETDDDDDDEDSRRGKLKKNSALATNSHSISPDDMNSVSTIVEWTGYQQPLQVLRHFGYRSSFVSSLLNAAAQLSISPSMTITRITDGSISGRLAIENVERHQTTFAVRGATVARPESYCLCMDEDIVVDGRKPIDVNKIINSHMSESENDDDDEETTEIRLQELQDYLIRKELHRRELQREVLPRVITSASTNQMTQREDELVDEVARKSGKRCVQFLNAPKYHAVCMITPLFACGPISEPVTIICVAIATEDGCFLSGLRHRFELGHMYPEDELTEIVERSALCIATVDWIQEEDRESLVSNDDHAMYDNSSQAEDEASGRLSVRDDVSEDASVAIENSGRSYGDGSSEEDEGGCDNDPKGPNRMNRCRCIYRNVGNKLDEYDDDDQNYTRRRIHRGRFSPGSWHCYTAVVDDNRTELRVDGMKEGVEHHHFVEYRNGRPMLDGLTLGSDHCFGISLCCGQHMERGGDGAIAEVAVFKGRLPTDDLERLEAQMMREHCIGRPHSPESAFQENNCLKKAEILYLWPPPSESLLSSSHEMTEPVPLPLHYMTRHRTVSWKQYDPVSGDEVRLSRIGARNGGSSSDW
ncbi:hypothetical protein FisN_8Lh307 [Fistulifera solaris]|uniref:Uncharacterized protein n=1 Tax=Fistulifera solaris TaxID=1519565 RepID=A0A1Z5JN09_FISSO|nr:hypothetical protein FisN_8Lh307 [Fistulifera solaris]|eukprot:GAX15397.1 hypothetical protein FisN_8Lh307 [Fistulifera solaris]